MSSEILSTHITSDGVIAYVRQDGQIRIVRLDPKGGQRIK